MCVVHVTRCVLVVVQSGIIESVRLLGCGQSCTHTRSDDGVLLLCVCVCTYVCGAMSVCLFVCLCVLHVGLGQ
jgi:hypothetical protein